MEQMINFNKPYITGKEVHYIYDAVATGKISGNGKYSNKCHKYLQKRYGFKKVLLTTSCTDALEMCALLLDIKPGDEVIVPSYTFVSTALAFVRQGATIRFVDSRPDHPGLDEDKIEELVNDRTKAIVVVHYAGIASDMEKIMAVSGKYGDIAVVEDAAQAIDSFYTREQKIVPLGSIGHLATFSFHETKNIQCGEGGCLVVNSDEYIDRSEIIWEKGTNRAQFFRGEVDKYGWVDIGSSFLPSEITAAFLWAQLEEIDGIQSRRKKIWTKYYDALLEWGKDRGISLPYIPSYATNNAHMFYLLCNSLKQRTRLIKYLKKNNVLAVFHYLSLHKSKYYSSYYDGPPLRNADKYTNRLVRLPLYYELSEKNLNYIIGLLKEFR